MELGTHHVSEDNSQFRAQIEELEYKLTQANKRQGGGFMSEHEAGVENANLHKQLEAKEEMNRSMEKRMKELEGDISHLKSTVHQQKEINEHQKKTMDEHLEKMEEAAKIADHRAKTEMEKLGQLAAAGGISHKEKDIGGVHIESTKVELSLSYDASHEMVVNAMVANMKRMHELDSHRIKELNQRVQLLEHQSAVDYEREHRMIEEWEHAIQEESRMRMDIHKMSVTIKSHDHDLHITRQEAHEWKEKMEMYKNKYDQLEEDRDKQKAKKKHWKKEAKEWEEKHDKQKAKKKQWKLDCKEWEHKYEEIHHHYEELKHTVHEHEEKANHWEV